MSLKMHILVFSSILKSVIKSNNSLETMVYGNCFAEREDLISKKNCPKFLVQPDV